jgi:hypothetical protein
MHDVQLPPEPETITVQRAKIDPNTGAVVADGPPQTIQVVWTECEAPNYLNPFDTTVKLKPTLPKDKALEIAYHTLLKTAGAVSSDWIREHTDDIENPAEEKKRCDGEGRRTFRGPASEGHQPAEGTGRRPDQVSDVDVVGSRNGDRGNPGRA